MTRVVGLEQINFAFRFLLWNLPQNVFGKMMLKLAKRSHSVVDAVEQDENGQSGEPADTKSD